MMMLPDTRKRTRTMQSTSDGMALPPPSKKVARICSALPARLNMKTGEQQLSAGISPQEYLTQVVTKYGMDATPRDSLQVQDFFVEYTPEQVEAYDANVLNAIRSQNIEKLREFHSNGRPLQCSNRFGESLLHLACRRGFVDVASFLILEANISVQVRDDYGRTILHDAAWACEPNFELIEMILTKCPDLLFMKDRRGHTPTSYARQSHWTAWKQFMSDKPAELLLPRVLNTVYNKEQ